MKKLFILSFVLLTALIASAQTAKESMIMLDKQQLSGYLIDLPNSDVKTADAAFRDKLEKNYNLKASKEADFRAYLNQPFSPFGTSNYDIYYTVTEYGKKKNRTTQLALIVCTGNKNAISSQTDPTTADYIKVFLRDFVKYIDIYNNQQKANALENQLSKLNKEKQGLEKEQGKIGKQIDKLNRDLDKKKEQIKEKENKIQKVESELQQVKKELK